MEPYIGCPACSRPMIGTPSGWVCEHCGGRLIQMPPRMENETTAEYRQRTKEAVREAEQRRIEARKKEREVDWETIRKSLF